MDRNLFSNNHVTYQVDSIKIIGNDITEEFIILRELNFKIGDVVNENQLLFNRERVFSLGLFSKVLIYPKVQDDYTSIVIEVNESWYIYPIPFIRKSNAPDSYSYGINLSYKNFRGRNEHLRAVISLGYDPYFSIFYENPALLYSEDLGIRVGFFYLNSQNKSSLAKRLYGGDFDSRFVGGSVSLAKRLNQYNSFNITSSFHYIKHPENNIRGISASGQNIDRVYTLGGAYHYDSRDLKQFPQKGFYFGTLFLRKGFGIQNVDYNIFAFDYRHHEKLFGELTTRWRLAFRHTFGRLIPFYDYSYLGYDEYVRGHSNDLREGHNMVLTSFEASYPILKEWDVSIKLPLIPQSLTSARVGIFINVFADAGNTFNNNKRFLIGDFYSGYGVGITFLVLPFNAVRIEYAIGDHGKGEFLLGTGFAF